MRRGKRKNVVVVWIVWVVVVVVAYTPWSPELPSDREDSDSRLTGSAKDVVASSPYAGGEPPPVVIGRSGSSKVTLLLVPEGPLSDMVFRRSLFSFLASFLSFTDSTGWLSVAVLARPGSRTLDFRFVGLAAITSIVGAVVMISGARKSAFRSTQVKQRGLELTLWNRRRVVSLALGLESRFRRQLRIGSVAKFQHGETAMLVALILHRRGSRSFCNSLNRCPRNRRSANR